MTALCPLCRRNDKVLLVSALASNRVFEAKKKFRWELECPTTGINRVSITQSLREWHFSQTQRWVDKYKGKYGCLFTLLLWSFFLFLLSGLEGLFFLLLLAKFRNQEVIGVIGVVIMVVNVVMTWIVFPEVAGRMVDRFYEAEVTRIKKRWEQVCYCERCDVVFLPRSSSFAPPEKIRRLLRYE